MLGITAGQSERRASICPADGGNRLLSSRILYADPSAHSPVRARVAFHSHVLRFILPGLYPCGGSCSATTATRSRTRDNDACCTGSGCLLSLHFAILPGHVSVHSEWVKLKLHVASSLMRSERAPQPGWTHWCLPRLDLWSLLSACDLGHCAGKTLRCHVTGSE